MGVTRMKRAMRRTKFPLPEHDLRLEDYGLYVNAELWVGGRLVAETSLSPGTTPSSTEAMDFVRQYFHLPPLDSAPRKRKK